MPDNKKTIEEVIKLKEQQTKLMASINSAKIERDKLIENNKRLDERKAKTEKSVETIEAKSKSMTDSIDAKRTEFVSYKKKAVEELNDEREVLNKEIAELSAKKISSLSAIDDIEMEYKSIKASYDRMVVRLQKAESELTGVQEDKAEVEEYIKLLKVSENKESETLSKLKEEVEVYKIAKEDLDKVLSDKEIASEEVGILNEETSLLKANNDKLDSLFSEKEKELEADIEKLEEEKAKEQKEVDSLTATAVNVGMLKEQAILLLEAGEEIYKKAGIPFQLSEELDKLKQK